MVDKNELLYPDGGKTSVLFYDFDKQSKEQDSILRYLSNKIEKQEMTYTSTLANNLFLDNVRSSINVFTLLLIVVMVVNIFASEAHYKTDQMIVPTKVGNTKLSIAKIICGTSIAVGIIFAQWIAAFLVACIYLPIHDLQGVVISQLGAYSPVLNFAFTYQELILWGLLVTMLSGILISAITMGISYFTRNRFWASVPVMFFLFVTLILPVFSRVFDLSWLDCVMPGRAIMFEDLLHFGNTYNGYPYLVIGTSVIPSLWIVVGSYTLVSVLLYVIILWHSKKHIVNNR